MLPIDVVRPSARADRVPRSVLLTCLVIGFGGLFAGVTGPLISTFVPPMVQDAIGDRRTLIGAVLAIDNVLLLLLVPLAGAASDRMKSRGGRRLPLVIAGYALAAAGMAFFPFAVSFGIAGLITAMVVLYVGVNVQRSPFQALIADAVPSIHRSIATGAVTFQMCAGAIVFLMLGRMLGMRPAFLIAAGAVLAIGLAFVLTLRERTASAVNAAEATVSSLWRAVQTAVGGRVPGLRAIFVATVLLQLTFQTFTTWYALHVIERFGMRPEDAAIGFIAWALGGVIGAIPAGFIGRRLGRRTTMLLGFALMAASLLLLDQAGGTWLATPLIAVASACWTLPMVNAYPLFIEPIPPGQRGVLAALFLLSMALGGAIGDPLNGGLFDMFNGYHPLFLVMTAYTALAFVTVLFVPRGAGEPESGAASFPPPIPSR